MDSIPVVVTKPETNLLVRRSVTHLKQKHTIQAVSHVQVPSWVVGWVRTRNRRLPALSGHGHATRTKCALVVARSPCNIPPMRLWDPRFAAETTGIGTTQGNQEPVRQAFPYRQVPKKHTNILAPAGGPATLLVFWECTEPTSVAQQETPANQRIALQSCRVRPSIAHELVFRALTTPF